MKARVLRDGLPAWATTPSSSVTASRRTVINIPPCGWTPPLAALAYDAVSLAVDGLKRSGTSEGAPFRDALAATKDFPGVTGKISLDQDRNPTKPGIVIRVEDGKFTYLETVEAPQRVEMVPPAAQAAPAPQVEATVQPAN